MQNVIVGTAGHVDHGKTCLIKALTGVDTDRLKEEKKRGITIELGFANLPNDEGLRIGIIDVPGHEKFVKNMLAGIGGIDLVLMVIALDEGVMPQTVEHFEILKMLQIKRGFIVLTKADLVDEEWAMLVEEDVRELVKGSFLEGAPMFRVSSYTGQNIALLKENIINQVKNVGKRRQEAELFRLPIDRVFTMEGFGTVVTGTLMEGSCRLGEEIMLYPQERAVKIRGVQTHGSKEEEATAGQRTALNLTGIKKEEMERGQVLASPGSMEVTTFLDVKIRLFGSTERKLRNGDRVHLSYGSAQTICKVILFGTDCLEAGEEGCAQLRFDEGVAVKRGDRFIIRFYSPVETFGGGIILDCCAQKHKRGHEEILDGMAVKELGEDPEILAQILKETGRQFPDVSLLAVRMGFPKSETEELLEKLKKEKKAIVLADGSWIHMDFWKEITDCMTLILTKFHEENPITSGMEKEELKSHLAERYHLDDMKKAELLVLEAAKRKAVTVESSTVAAAGFSNSYSQEMAGMAGKIEDTYRRAGFEMPLTDDVLKEFTDKKLAKQMVLDMIKSGTLVKVNVACYMHREHWERALGILKKKCEENGSVSLGEYRDLLGTSRKYAVMILEYCDQQKITKKSDDVRSLLGAK